jgi:hypothetical protein
VSHDDPDIWRVEGRTFIVTVVSANDGPGLDLDEATPGGDKWIAEARCLGSSGEISFETAADAPVEVIERFRQHAQSRLQLSD